MALGLALLVLLTGVSTVVVVHYAVAPRPFPINHIVFVVMENRAYDSYFGTYCQQLGPACSGVATGLPGGLCVPFNASNPSTGCVRPFNFNASQRNYLPNMLHQWTQAHTAYANGTMNGFYGAEASGVEPFGHMNGTTIPTYWDIAQQFALGDSFFSSELSFSLPNHWHLVAGNTPAIFNGPTGYLHNISDAHTYLNESNQTRTIQDLLLNSSVTWKYYDYRLDPTYKQATGQLRAGEYGAFNVWNPMASKAESYNLSFYNHFDNVGNFFGDVANRSLPQVSWVIPQFTESDHPPDNVTYGERFVASVVDSVAQSPYWNSTAIFTFWDDYGGFYDHVAPPQILTTGLGFRVPLLVISPYTPQGAIVHQFTYFESMLRLVEWRFGLPCLTAADCEAPLPLDFFDFSMAPRAPVLFSTDVLNATYPMQAGSAPATFDGVPASVLNNVNSTNLSLAD